jgi:4-hydroxy-tetrahydrodipicolinate synthase
MDNGAAGVMIAPLAGLSTEEKIYNYFGQVFAALGDEVPVCYQDYPFATRSDISVPLFNRLVSEFEQLVMLKHEDWPGLNKITEVRKSSEKGVRRVSVLVGNGGLYLPQELARGADGAMTGFAYPEMLVQVVQMHAAGKHDEAEDLFDAYLPLVRHEQQPGFGLAVRKEVLYRRGVIASPTVRAPGPKLNAIDQKELARLIDRVERNAKAL